MSQMPTQPKDFVSSKEIAKLSEIGRNPMELKRRDQSREGYVWFATYDTQLLYEEELRKVLNSPEYGENHSGFPKVLIEF